MILKTEKAPHAGTCYICARTIYKDDIIVIEERPMGIVLPRPIFVAAHAACHPDFKIGG